jgi:DNA polymerase III delta prime subunit
VRIIGTKLGYHILELNASDARGKNKIEELLKDLSKR